MRSNVIIALVFILFSSFAVQAQSTNNTQTPAPAKTVVVEQKQPVVSLSQAEHEFDLSYTAWCKSATVENKAIMDEKRKAYSAAYQKANQ